MPAKLVADTRTAAGEINARRQDVDNRHRDADVEIERLQAVVEQAPQRGATAANTLADVGREQTIRASQPAEVQQLERETAAVLREQQAEAQRTRTGLQQAEAALRVGQNKTPGPDQGHGIER